MRAAIEIGVLCEVVELVAWAIEARGDEMAAVVAVPPVCAARLPLVPARTIWAWVEM